jgi:hypothetical protein
VEVFEQDQDPEQVRALLGWGCAVAERRMQPASPAPPTAPATGLVG